MATQKSSPKSTPKNKNKKKSIPWDRDAVENGESSITILLNWLTAGNNFSRWRGDTEQGLTKETLCSEIINIMKAKGITHRDKKGIRQKISDLQSSYTTASDWKNNTGAGILERDEINGIKTVDEYIKSVCRYWDLLHPIMGSRSFTQPLDTRSNITSNVNTQDDFLNLTDQHEFLPSLEGSGDPREADEEENPDDTINSKSHKRKKQQQVHKPQSKKKKKTIEEVFMRSMINKSVADIHHARAICSKAKVAFMHELREQGYVKEEIAYLTEKEFAPIAQPSDEENNDNDNDDDSE